MRGTNAARLRFPADGPDDDGAEEAQLVLAAMSGEADAVRTLWERHRRWIAAVILAHKPSAEDLDDLLQEVAVTFVAKLDSLRDPRNLRAWLRTIAVNAARASGRRGRYRVTTSLADDGVATDGRNGAIGHLARDETTRRMLRRVDALPETYREPLLLRALQGLRSKQIAMLLDIPPATVDTRIARGRRMLAELCADLLPAREGRMGPLS
ncbi:MAG: RNA polymerase sigma factor [Phycisphaerales bacterium]|nr:RNA polymerase sigma factor [Phycisphaerae bacterium]NNF43945.1 RNA polymerase sigma factor [Phycisphaerales bacterium]NNM26038.1 RNA polymerase sigma factor [Phycisphaerales bacterium]